MRDSHGQLHIVTLREAEIYTQFMWNRNTVTLKNLLSRPPV